MSLTVAKMASHRPCPQCGFPVHTAASRCADCGRRQGWLRLRRPSTEPLQTIEATLAAQVMALSRRREGLEQARAEALTRMQGADARRAASLSALLGQLDEGLSQVAALIARCNDTRRTVLARRVQMVEAASRSELAALLQRKRPAAALGAVRSSLRWTDTAPRQAALVSPSGRRVALVGGGEVVLVDLLSRSSTRIDRTGVHGLQFSADERMLRFAGGPTWGCTTRGWLPLPGAWIAPQAPSPMVSLATLPHTAEIAAPDPRWQLAAEGGAVSLVCPRTRWSAPLLSLPGRRGVHMVGTTVLVVEPDVPRLQIYTLQPAPGLRWDAWALRDTPGLDALARAVVLGGLLEEMAALRPDDAALGTRAVQLLQGAALLGEAEIVEAALAAVDGALAAGCQAALQADGDPRARGQRVEALGQIAAQVAAAAAPGPTKARLEELAAHAPSWSDVLLVEAASGALVSLTGGEAIRMLDAHRRQAEAARPVALPPGASRVEAPDPEAALSELADIQRDIHAQLAALGEAGRG